MVVFSLSISLSKLTDWIVEEVEKRGGTHFISILLSFSLLKGKAFICGTPVVSDGETNVRVTLLGLFSFIIFSNNYRDQLECVIL